MFPRRSMFRGYMKLITLYVLKDQPKHVYGLIKSLEDLIGVRPSTGVIYPILKSSIRDGLVSVETLSTESKETKVYKLSEEGLKYLELHESDLKKALKLAESFKKFRLAGCDKLLDLVKEIILNAGRLNDAELLELRKAITEFEARVLEILVTSRGVSE
ncbi:MAG: PadR family transcriptional regulator [Zestosphaera sp.]